MNEIIFLAGRKARELAENARDLREIRETWVCSSSGVNS